MDKCKFYRDGYCYAQKGAPSTSCKGDMTECTDDEIIEEVPSYYSVFKNHLKIGLRRFTKDFTKIYFVDDVLLVEFYHLGNLTVTYVETGIFDKIAKGLDTQALAEKIVKWYKKVIISRYFY